MSGEEEFFEPRKRINKTPIVLGSLAVLVILLIVAVLFLPLSQKCPSTIKDNIEFLKQSVTLLSTTFPDLDFSDVQDNITVISDYAKEAENLYNSGKCDGAREKITLTSAELQEVTTYLEQRIVGEIEKKTSKIISVLDSSCTFDGKITLLVMNQGRNNIENGELQVFVKGEDKTSDFSNIDPIETGKSVLAQSSTSYPTGVYEVKIKGPSNDYKITVFC